MFMVISSMEQDDSTHKCYFEINGDELPFINELKAIKRNPKYDPENIKYPCVEIVYVDLNTMTLAGQFFASETDAITFGISQYQYCEPRIVYVIDKKLETKPIPLRYLIFERMISPLAGNGTIRYEVIKMPTSSKLRRLFKRS